MNDGVGQRPGRPAWRMKWFSRLLVVTTLVALMSIVLAPGASAELTESWELHGGVPPVSTEDDVDRVILPLIERGSRG